LLKVDKELAHGLILHLEPVIYRLQYNLPILNDCLEEILEEHAEVYRSARLGVAEMEKELGVPVPPEEIGFLAMYLKAALNRLRIHDRNSHPVVILGDGIRAKTSLLKARLEYELPTLDVIAVFNSYQLDQSILDRAELVLSLIPSEVAGVTCMQVSPFLDPVEKRQIQTWINEQEEKSRKLAFGPHDKPDLVDLLLPQNIQFAASEEDWRAVVSKASQPLIKSGEIEPEYIAGMIKIIEDYGPYMILAPGVIVLHARPVDGVNNVCLSTLILRQPVPFSQEESGQIDIAFVLGAIDDDSHLNALFQLNNLLSQREFTSALRTASKPADVLRAIWSYSSLVDIQ
jgi:mannitol/fructose-specific phosphotransferase system IIA component (Ntr-type)